MQSVNHKQQSVGLKEETDRERQTDREKQTENDLNTRKNREKERAKVRRGR
jgi:hypothetical protein